MGFAIESSGKTDVGLVRERNEDSMGIEPKLGLYIVCDGMGGHVGGQVASQLSVSAVVEAMQSDDTRLDEAPDHLVTAIRRANSAVFSKARAEPELYNMGTTIVAVRQDKGNLHLCHVGDSRIYRLRNGKLEQLTRDHSLVNLYLDSPLFASRFGPPNSNVIVRAVGLSEKVEVDHASVPMEAADLYLLCSDGLTDMLEDSAIQDVMLRGTTGSLDECCDLLVEKALANGGVDNVTAVLLRVKLSD